MLLGPIPENVRVVSVCVWTTRKSTPARHVYARDFLPIVSRAVIFFPRISRAIIGAGSAGGNLGRPLCLR